MEVWSRCLSELFNSESVTLWIEKDKTPTIVVFLSIVWTGEESNETWKERRIGNVEGE